VYKNLVRSKIINYNNNRYTFFIAKHSKTSSYPVGSITEKVIDA